MDIEQLKKAYEALEMLHALNLPVSEEQLRGISELEKNYIHENVIPALKNEIAPFYSSMRGDSAFTVKYEQNKISIHINERKKINNWNDISNKAYSNKVDVKSDINVGTNIRWRLSGEIGKVIELRNTGINRSIVIKFSNGSVRVYNDNPLNYDIIE